MGRAKSYFERRSLRTALGTYLQNAGWTVEMREGWFSDDEISTDTVAVWFLPSSISELQIGRGAQEKGLVRRIQVNAYMDNEHKAQDIVDEIMEFIDAEPVTVQDANSNTLASFICYDTGSISGEVVPPIMRIPKVSRWRGVVKATYEAHYFDD